MQPRHEVKIDLWSQPRFNAKPPTFSPRESAAWEKWFTKALKDAERPWIRPSSARHSSSLLFVPKPNTDELRLCVNYVKLNEHVKPRVFAPRTDKKLRHQIASHTWYSKIDLKDAFYAMDILENDRWKTAFRTPKGLYEWNVLPMGLKNAPGEFQLYMEEILADLLHTACAVHIDDIVVYAQTRDECQRRTSQVHHRLRKHNLPVNEEKSVSCVTEVTFCGFKFSKDRICPPDRSHALRDWPEPKNPTQLRQFLGTTNDLRDHIPKYAMISAPLYASTAQNKEWRWTRQQHDAFLRLRRAACDTITTTPHDETRSAKITTDASLFGISCIITQRGRITAAWSRSLTPAERNYTTNERELLAVVEGLRKFTYLLEIAPSLLVVTDNQINASALTPNQSNRRINRWIETLQAYPLIWKWEPGETNIADHPSRRPDYRKEISI